MALAFKRAVAEAEKTLESANQYIKTNYKPSVYPALLVDFDGIKAVEGTSTQNSNKAELPKNITLCNWIKDYVLRFHAVWGDIQAKDKKNALPILLQNIEKVVVHLDDKCNGKKYNSYDARVEGKDLHVTVHIDFDNHLQQPNLTDDRNGINIIQFLWDYLNDKANIAFQVAKLYLLEHQSSALQEAKKKLKDTLKKDIPVTIHFDEIEKIPGKSIRYASKPPEPNNFQALNFLGEGRGLQLVVQSIAGVCKDAMGLEAFLESFEHLHVHVETGSKEARHGPHQMKKTGKELHFHFVLNGDHISSLAFFDPVQLAKDIEALLS